MDRCVRQKPGIEGGQAEITFKFLILLLTFADYSEHALFELNFLMKSI